MSPVCPFAFFVAKTSTYDIGGYVFTLDTARTVPDAFWTSSNAGELAGHLDRYEIAAYDYSGNEIASEDATIMLGNYMASRSATVTTYDSPCSVVVPSVKKMVIRPVVERDVQPIAKIVPIAENMTWYAGDVFLVVVDDSSPTTACAEMVADVHTWDIMEVGSIRTLYSAASDFVRVQLPDNTAFFLQPRAEAHVIKLGTSSYTYHIEHGPGAVDIAQHFVTAAGTPPGGWRAAGAGGSVNWGVYSPGVIGLASLNGSSTVGESYRIESGEYIIQNGKSLLMRAVAKIDIPWTNPADDSEWWIGVGMPSGSTLSRALGARYSAADGGLVGVAGTSGSITASSWSMSITASQLFEIVCVLRSDWATAKWYGNGQYLGTIDPFPSLSVMSPVTLIEKKSGTTAQGASIDLMEIMMTL